MSAMFAEKAAKQLNCFFNNQKVPCKSFLLLKQTSMRAGDTMKMQEEVAETHRRALSGSCVDPAVNSWI